MFSKKSSIAIEKVALHDLANPHFVKPMEMTYTQDGIRKRWEIAQVHDSVAILLYHTERESFILVKQFRPPVYLNNSNGFTYELCAGICDKALDLSGIAAEEVHEETGYLVDSKDLEEVTSFYTAVGFAGSRQTLFYAEVDESMHDHDGGGIEEESIEVIELPVSQARAFILDADFAKTPGLMFSFMWWFEKKSLS